MARKTAPADRTPSRYVEFTADHDYTWPSRAVTAFKAGWSGRVKGEVAERAIAAKKAKEIDPPARDETPPLDGGANSQ